MHARDDFPLRSKPPLMHTMARRFAARHRARDDMSCCPPRSGGHQLNGADTAPCGRGCASLAPFGWQNDYLQKESRLSTIAVNINEIPI